MKKALFLLLALFLLTVSVGAVDLFIDTLRIDTDTPPTIVDGRTLVPVRAIFESLGATVNWDASTKTATGLRGGTTVVVQIDNKTAYVNGRAQTLDVPAKIINGRTMVTGGGSGDASNFDTYSIPEQQQTSARYVLNTNTMKIHYPRCDSVEKIKPENYATSNLDVSELVAQGYKPCGVCKP